MDKMNTNKSGKKLKYDEKATNCQINYITIDKLWRYCGNSPQDLYFQLGITENKFSKIRTGVCPLAYLEKIWNEPQSPLKKLGLPREIMLGEATINIKGISENDWEEYLSERYENKSSQENKKKKMRKFDIKLKKAFSELKDDRKPKSNIEKLYYFIKHGAASDTDFTDREMKELKEALERIRIDNIKNCDNQLREEVESIMKKVLYKIDAVITYNNLE